MSEQIEEIRKDKQRLDEKITELMNEFEKKHGEGFAPVIRFNRYNGSNNAWGTIMDLKLEYRL